MCNYYKENGKTPCCTHDCNGCMWFEDDMPNDEYEELDFVQPVEYRFDGFHTPYMTTFNEHEINPKNGRTQKRYDSILVSEKYPKLHDACMRQEEVVLPKIE